MVSEPIKIAALESERKAHNKGISDSRFRLQTISHDIANNETAISRMKEDAARYAAVVQRDKDGWKSRCRLTPVGGKM